jgi:hypothetical protein
MVIIYVDRDYVGPRRRTGLITPTMPSKQAPGAEQ